MCTAISMRTAGLYFGRTLDYDFSYGEQVVIAPRRYPFDFRKAGKMNEHYAIIGMAHMRDGYPLFYDAGNEKGLAIAGLNFVGNAVYRDSGRKIQLAQFELIPYLLGSCATVGEALRLLKNIDLLPLPFSDGLPVAQLHWLLADGKQTVVVEFTRDGLQLYKNPTGVLTNNPPFPLQMFALNNFCNVSVREPRRRPIKGVRLNYYSRGMGAMGLPGDWSSQSRFVRAAFTLGNSVSGDGERESVTQFFHVLATVEQPRAVCRIGDGQEITVYTACFSAVTGIYYYKTYENHRIRGVELFSRDLDRTALYEIPLVLKEDFPLEPSH